MATQNNETQFTLQVHDLANGSQIRLVNKKGATVETWSNTPFNFPQALKSLNRHSQDAGDTRRDAEVR